MREVRIITKRTKKVKYLELDDDDILGLMLLAQQALIHKKNTGQFIKGAIETAKDLFRALDFDKNVGVKDLMDV